MKKGIKYVSFCGDAGYAVAAKRHMLGLVNRGVKITWTPMVDTPFGRLGFAPSLEKNSRDPELDPFCNIEIDYDTVIVHMVPEYFPMWKEREPGKRIIGCTVWETDLIPKHWLELLNSVDALIVPCHWNKEVFIKNGVTVPIFVIPHTALAQQTKQSLNWRNIPQNDFVFYSINTWTVRKSIWLTLEAYLNAFTATDPVCLVIKSTKLDYTKPERRWRKILGWDVRPDSKDQVQKIISCYSNPPKVIFIDEVISDQEIAELHQRGDCYLSLCRSEGWGIGAFDACAYGNPVVMTGYGGQLDYLPAKDAYLIKYKLINVSDRSSWGSYRSDAFWADPDIQHATETLQEIFKNQQEAGIKGKNLQKFVCEEFSENKISDLFIELLQDQSEAKR